MPFAISSPHVDATLGALFPQLAGIFFGTQRVVQNVGRSLWRARVPGKRTHTHKHTLTDTHTDAPARVLSVSHTCRTCTHQSAYMKAHIRVCTITHTHTQSIIHTNTPTVEHMCAHIHKRTSTHIYAHTRTHTHTRTFTHSRSRFLSLALRT